MKRKIFFVIFGIFTLVIWFKMILNCVKYTYIVNPTFLDAVKPTCYLIVAVICTMILVARCRGENG